MTTLYLCGAGNPEGIRLALEINDVSSRWDAIVVLDDDASKHGHELMGVPIVGPFAHLAHVDPTTGEVANLVARTTKGRRGAGEKIASFGLPWASLIDPTVNLRGATVGTGVTVYRNATVSALSRLGDHSVVFAGANAGHGASIGDGAVLAPGAVINARVEVGEGAYVGTNASVLPDLAVGDWAVIGANSAVIEDVPSGATVMGVPAQVMMLSGEHGPTPPPVDLVRDAASPPEEVADLVATTWREALRVEKVGIDDNFFDLGGTSLLAVQVRLQIQELVRRPLSPTDIFRFPTVRQLATFIAGEGSNTAPHRGALRAERRRRRFARG